MPIHNVVQGECLLSIAEASGFFWETLWDHPENEGLKLERKDPAILFPGDKVYIPEKRIKELSEPTNQVHKYRVKNVPAKLKVRFLDDSDKPRANIQYSLMIDGKEFTGSTDGEGAINISIPPDAKKGTLIFKDKDEEYELALGYLDPVEEISGVQARLAGLGHYTGDSTGKVDDKTTEAIKEFQTSLGMEPSGELDEKLKNDLRSAYGS